MKRSVSAVVCAAGFCLVACSSSGTGGAAGEGGAGGDGGAGASSPASGGAGGDVSSSSGGMMGPGPGVGGMMGPGPGVGGMMGPGPGAGGGGMGPVACDTLADCDGKCPPDAVGCTCADTPMGKACIPTCTQPADCPSPPDMTLDCVDGVCVPAMP
ncbi:MAG: hypothetical protein U0271_28035 [Polyangiaceae bacterium]